MAPSWTTEGSSGYWPEAGLEMPQAQMSSMPMQECQASQLVQMPQMLTVHTPSNMANASGHADGLMAIAMPQYCCDMNGEQIAAQLLAAAPMCYED